MDTQPATVTVKAAYSKRRRKDVLPLRACLADDLRSHLGTKLPQAPAFTMPRSDKTAKMIRSDLAAARKAWIKAGQTSVERAKREQTRFLAYRDVNDLVADFHALRHTFISNLASSGVHPKTAQMLARHSTITLTMDRYKHGMWEQMDEALSRLPDLTNHVQSGRATGTDGKCDVPSVALCGARKVAEQCNTVQRDAVKQGSNADDRDDDKPGETREKTPEPSGWGGIRTPGTLSRTAVFKTAAENAQGQNQQQLTDNGVGSVARSVALLADESPDLAVVVEAWADLPQALRTGIVAMVTSAATN